MQMFFTFSKTDRRCVLIRERASVGIMDRSVVAPALSIRMRAALERRSP
jgi:hypothetical protein